jgi:subtilisin family serine protease
MLVLAACATPGPRHSSLEYRISSWGLRAIDADPAFRAGATGRGIVIAQIDCGVDSSEQEFARNLSAASIDLNPDRPSGEHDRHADYVAGPMDSALDGIGLVGVAYEATLLSIRADFDGGWNGACAFYPSDIARGLDYAREHGARIVILPVEAAHPLGPDFETALEKAAASDMAVVIAAGNEAGDQPAWPARYADDPRFAGNVLVVGAAHYDGTFAGWSNRAGKTQTYYLIAPGEKVLTECDRKQCLLVSGTSFSAAYAGGALALVMEKRPEMNGRVAIQALLQSARSVGPPDFTGQGILDIGRAFAMLKQAAPRVAVRPEVSADPG